MLSNEKDAEPRLQCSQVRVMTSAMITAQRNARIPKSPPAIALHKADLLVARHMTHDATMAHSRAAATTLTANTGAYLPDLGCVNDCVLSVARALQFQQR